MGSRDEPRTETDHPMLVVITVWLLLQLPVAFVLGHFIACPQKRQAMRRTAEIRRPAIAPRTRTA